MYISDPPIFADIGDFDFNINSSAFMTNFTTDMNSSDVLQIEIMNHSLIINQSFRMLFPGSLFANAIDRVLRLHVGIYQMNPLSLPCSCCCLHTDTNFSFPSLNSNSRVFVR